MRTPMLLLAVLSSGCTSIVASTMNGAVAKALNRGDGTLRMTCSAADLGDSASTGPGPGSGVVGLAFAPVSDERRSGDTLTWVDEKHLFDEGGLSLDGDQTAQVLKPGLRSAAHRDLPVLLARRGIALIDAREAPEGSIVLQATLVRSEVAFREADSLQKQGGLRGVIVLDMELGTSGGTPVWSRSFVGDTVVRKGPSALDLHYERAFSVAWCQALRQAAAAMDSEEFLSAISGP